MKTLMLFLILCLGSLAFADDFKTINGKEYKDAKISRVEPDGIVITFSGGIVKIPFNELSAEIQKKYGYDPQSATAYSAEQREQQAALEQQRKADEQQRFEERQKYWSEHPAPPPEPPADRRSIASSMHGSALDRDAGPKPEQLQDGTVVSLDQQIRGSLFDPDSLIYVSWGELKVGQSPGGNPVWTVTVTYRAKNKYGAYMGNRTASYWLKGGLWNLGN